MSPAAGGPASGHVVTRAGLRAQWNANAGAWTELSRAGFAVYRDLVNTPAFFEMLPSVAGLECLDLGCGEGHNTRLLAGQGARVAALDLAEAFITAAADLEAVAEPHADERTAAEHPEMADTRIVPYFLILRARKPQR